MLFGNEDAMRCTLKTVAVIVSVLLMAAAVAFPQQQSSVTEPRFDLGGPCRAKDGPVNPQLGAARSGGDWNRFVELQKESIRNSCGNQYRWYEIVYGLLKANRQAEALQALEEMDSRGFDLNPSLITGHEDVRAFMDSPRYKASALGARYERLKKTSDERRARYRAMLKSIPASQRPPDNYIAKGACPFECCQFGNWSALKDTELVAAPGSSRVVGRARKGGRVVAVTGEVHLKPEPVVVLAGPLPKGSIAFILDYGGEGEGRVFTQGKIATVFFGTYEYCLHPSDTCWGETLAKPEELRKPVWWVQIRLPNGVTGWTDKADNFDGKDACG